MAKTKFSADSLDLHAVLDGLGQGVLLFDSDDRLVLDNVAARALLGPNLVLLRAEGWRAAATLFDSAHDDRRLSADDIRARALRQAEPVRFHTFLAGAYTPCWATAIYGPAGAVYTLITLEQPDWSALTELMATFRAEARQSVSGTRGHAELIQQVLARRSDKTSVEDLARKVGGFAGLIAVQMYRMEILMSLLHRLEVIRTGELNDVLRANRRPVTLAEFFEDLLEDIGENPLTEVRDPAADPRDRIEVEVPGDIKIAASRQHLTAIARDLLRNSLLYSAPGSPIAIRASSSARMHSAQVDIVDQGYGIREKEFGKVFAPFQRARQPQIIAEFGYGLSLYLVKTEIEAMGGRIWFTSEEGVGTTFSFKLPLWRPSYEDE